MKDILIDIINKYLKIFPEEQDRQSKIIDYLNIHSNEEITDWNNFNGHIVAGGFIYAREEKKFLVLYHKDLNRYLYPGGHTDKSDINTLETAKREIKEETGLTNLEHLKLSDDELIPIDIDMHIINYNERLKLPEHYHFDFRYLFIIDKISNIKLDSEELLNYKWIDINELKNDINYGVVVDKIEKLIGRDKV